MIGQLPDEVGVSDTKQWILLVHLGPVQDFIASARKCRDLWFGSHLLSALSKAAAEGIAGALEAEGVGQDREETLVFPGKLDEGKSNVANKLQLVFKGDEELVKKVAEAGRKAMQDCLEEKFAKQAFDRVDSELLRRDVAESHIKDLMEYMWVAVPVEGDYANARSKAEGLLAARKNSRQWKQASADGAGVPKSSLDGMRESVIDESAYDKLSANKLREQAGVGEAERLCGVGVLKRLARPLDEMGGDLQPVFHSAGHIASAGLRARIAALDSAEKLADYIALLEAKLNVSDLTIRAHEYPGSEDVLDWEIRHQSKSISIPRVLAVKAKPKGLDGVVLYPSRIDRIVAEYGKDEGGLDDLKKAQRAVLHAAEISEPNPYYALILADGDKMGVALDAMKTSKAHRKFSEKLDQEFAVECRETVNKFGDSLLYAGGDDVLAMVPLFNALKCARELRKLFDKAMEKAISDDVLRGTDIARPTLSVGIAVCHFLEPLGNVREYAKKAEKAAKNDAGRNALAVLVKKRGGTEKLVYGKWDSELDKRLEKWGDLQARGALSRGLAHKLEEAVQAIDPLRLMGATKKGASDDKAMVQSLVKRVLNRRNLDGKKGNDEERKKLAQELEALADTYFTLDKDPYKVVRQISHELQIADLFGRALAEARGNARNQDSQEAAE